MSRRAELSRQMALTPPPEKFYWALLDAPPRGAGHEALRYAFEAWLPAPIDEVETRFLRLGGPRRAVLACGVERKTLRAWIEGAQRTGRPLESIRPSELPGPVLNEAQAAPGAPSAAALAAAMEFRSGAFLSPRRVRRRRAVRALVGASLLATTSLASLAMVREAGFARRDAEIAREASGRMIDGALGQAGGAAAGIDRRLRLAAELRRLEQTRDRSASGLLAASRAGAYIAILSAWPQDLRVRVDQLSAEQDTLTLRGEVRDAADFERLKLQVKGFAPGWREQSSTVSKGREGFNFTIVLRQDQGASVAMEERR